MAALRIKKGGNIYPMATDSSFFSPEFAERLAEISDGSSSAGVMGRNRLVFVS